MSENQTETKFMQNQKTRGSAATVRGACGQILAGARTQFIRSHWSYDEIHAYRMKLTSKITYQGAEHPLYKGGFGI